MKRFLAIAIAVAAFIPQVFAGGETGADILKLATGSRAMALGGAYAAMGNDAEAVNYNPAAIMSVDKKEISFLYWITHSGSNVMNGSYGQPIISALLEGAAGISFLYRSIPAIANADAAEDSVQYYDMCLTAAYANGLDRIFSSQELKGLNAGLAVKLVQETIGQYQASTFAFDAGVQYAPGNQPFRLGASVQNIGPGIKFLSETSPLPLTARVGAAYYFQIDKDNNMALALDYIQDFYSYGRFAVGIEDSVLGLLFLRGGYNVCVDTRTPQSLYLGAGLAITQFDVTVGLNYVYSAVLWNGFNAFDSTHMAGLVVKL